MASTPLGDIIGARFFDTVTVAALTSAAAAGTVAIFGPFLHPIKPSGLFFTPLTSGGIAATQTGSYRQYSLINPGSTGTSVVTVASFNSSFATNATVASFVATPQAAFLQTTVVSNQTVPAGRPIYVTQTTVGGNDSNGTVMPACGLSLAYEVV